MNFGSPQQGEKPWAQLSFFVFQQLSKSNGVVHQRFSKGTKNFLPKKERRQAQNSLFRISAFQKL